MKSYGKEVNWEGNQPAGGMSHVAGFDSKGIRVADVWNSEQEFKNFVDARLVPAFQKRNIPLPEAEIIQIHNINVFPQLERYKVAQAQ